MTDIAALYAAARYPKPSPASRRSSAMLDAALEYAARGVPVFQMWHATDGRCGCRALDCDKPGKHPVGSTAPQGFKNATTDPATIRRWWAHDRFPDANIAEATGRFSVVLDVDPRAGGRETLTKLEAQHGALPRTSKVLTGGGGVHYRFKPVPGLGCSAGRVGPGVDIRAEGGCATLPPSNHASGGTYRDDEHAPLFETPLAPMPGWLVALAMTPAASNGDGHRATPDEWATKLAGAEIGKRRAVALEIAGHYLGLRIAPAEVETILLGYAARCIPSFPEREARELVRDLARHDRAKAQAVPLRSAAAADAEDVTVPASAALGIGLGQFLRLAKDLPAIEPYVDGVLTSEGSGWIGGEEKLGKTYYALEEAVCLATGLPVCNRFTVPLRRRVLFVEEEDGPRRTNVRVRALLRGHGLDPDDEAVAAELDTWFRVSVWSGFTFDDRSMIARLEADLREFRPAVCYIDVLRKVTLRDLNKAAEASALLGVLDAFRRQYGTVFRVLHHFRKVQGFRTGRGSQEIGGSFVLGAWAESSLFFEPIGRKQGAVRVDVQTKDGAPLAPFRLRIESEGPRHAPTLVRLLADEEHGENDADEVVFQAVATLPTVPALAGEPGVGVAEIARAIKKSEKTVRRSLKTLQEAGRVGVVGNAERRRELFGVSEK